MNRITIFTDNFSIDAEIFDTTTAKKIMAVLPLDGFANVWGNEIYFEIPIAIELEPDSGQEIKLGELGYWPSGRAFCIFFGKTPCSVNEKPRAYSPVNIFGRIIGDAGRFTTVKEGTKIEIVSKC